VFAGSNGFAGCLRAILVLQPMMTRVAEGASVTGVPKIIIGGPPGARIWLPTIYPVMLSWRLPVGC